MMGVWNIGGLIVGFVGKAPLLCFDTSDFPVVIFILFFRVEKLIISHCTYILAQKNPRLSIPCLIKKEKYQEIVLLYQVMILGNLRERPCGV